MDFSGNAWLGLGTEPTAPLLRLVRRLHHLIEVREHIIEQDKLDKAGRRNPLLQSPVRTENPPATPPSANRSGNKMSAESDSQGSLPL